MAGFAKTNIICQGLRSKVSNKLENGIQCGVLEWFGEAQVGTRINEFLHIVDGRVSCVVSRGGLCNSVRSSCAGKNKQVSTR